MSDLLAAALEYAEQGMPVFPCNPATKQPLTGGGFKNATTDDDTIRSWWSAHPDAMIGIPTGSACRAWVLDIDDPELFEGSCQIELPETRRSDTGKGYHLWFRFDPSEEVRNAQVKQVGGKRAWPFPELSGAEVRGEGGYVIVPPSVHPNGRIYQWSCEAAIAEPPVALLRIVRKQRLERDRCPEAGQVEPAAATSGKDSNWGLAALEGECASIRQAGDGAQEGTLNEAALKIGAIVAGGQLNANTARSRLIAAALEMPSYDARRPWTPELIAGKIERGLADGARNPRAPERRVPQGFMKFGPDVDDKVLQHDPEASENIDRNDSEDDGRPEPRRKRSGIKLEDFHAYMPAHNYLFGPSGESWPGASVNARFPPIPLLDAKGNQVLNKKDEPVMLTPAQWLDQNRAVEQLTWAPGEPQVVADRLISDGGWFPKPNCHVFNLYRPPLRVSGNARQARPWLDHIRRVYPDDADHLVRWLAHRVQRPQEKINHALVLGGSQGIGKDTILEPVKAGIGPWNFAEVSPQHLLGRFNGFVKSVILRVSEARDLGDVDRFAFYDHMKTFTAAPPDVLRVDEKHVREYAVFNVCGVIITTNHKTDGIFLPADDRRHYVAWSPCSREDFGPDYWPTLHGWYASGGTGHVVAYLATLPLEDFDAKAPPAKTAAFWDIVAANQAPEDAELADALEKLEWPAAVTKSMIAEQADFELQGWLRERRNSRSLPHRLEKYGYVAVRNEAAEDGQFKVAGKRCTIYARKQLPPREQIIAAHQLVRDRAPMTSTAYAACSGR